MFRIKCIRNETTVKPHNFKQSTKQQLAVCKTRKNKDDTLQVIPRVSKENIEGMTYMPPPTDVWGYIGLKDGSWLGMISNIRHLSWSYHVSAVDDAVEELSEYTEWTDTVVSCLITEKNVMA